LYMFNKNFSLYQNTKKGKSCFEIRTPEKNYLFSAENEGEMEDWIKVLNKVRTAAETMSQVSIERSRGKGWKI